MDWDDFNLYFSQFQAYCQHIQTSDESMLVMLFVDSRLYCSTQCN